MELFTTILGWINPIKWAERGFAFLNRPKLSLYFDTNQSYHTRNLVDHGGVPGFFCHVMVKNNGKLIAKKCRARLLEVSIQDIDGISFMPAQGFVSPVTLKWAHEPDFEPRDIEPDLPRRLDLCYSLQSQQDRIIFFAPPIPLGVQIIFPRGVYRVKIRVDAENAKSTDGVFVVNHRRNWNEISIAELK